MSYLFGQSHLHHDPGYIHITLEAHVGGGDEIFGSDISFEKTSKPPHIPFAPPPKKIKKLLVTLKMQSNIFSSPTPPTSS
jgi:hypothetical protein